MLRIRTHGSSYPLEPYTLFRRTTHFVGYLFWSYAHFACAREIECRSDPRAHENKNKPKKIHSRKNSKKGHTGRLKQKGSTKRILQENKNQELASKQAKRGTANVQRTTSYQNRIMAKGSVFPFPYNRPPTTTTPSPRVPTTGKSPKPIPIRTPSSENGQRAEQS